MPFFDKLKNLFRKLSYILTKKRREYLCPYVLEFRKFISPFTSRIDASLTAFLNKPEVKKILALFS